MNVRAIVVGIVALGFLGLGALAFTQQCPGYAIICALLACSTIWSLQGEREVNE